MSAKLGLVGLPNAGKSTLFNALTSGKAQVAPYPFTTTDRNVGVAPVQDARLDTLARLVPHDRVIPTNLECVDIAGLVKGAHQGEGLGNQFLSHVFAVDVLLHVVRCFEDGNVAHVMGSVDPARDVDMIATELLLKDLEIIERRFEKERKLAKSGDQHAQALVEQLAHWKDALGQGRSIRTLGLAPDRHPKVFGVELLSSKPVIYVGNVDEASLTHPPPAGTLSVPALRSAPTAFAPPAQRLIELAKQDGSALVFICAKLEAELAELEAADRAAMMAELGVAESALPQIVRAGYATLGLITFFTTASRLLQAWTVPRGTTAPHAVGTIHSDFERKFIRAEVISVEQLAACGGEGPARAKGLLRTEGKDYVVQDGDVLHVKI